MLTVADLPLAPDAPPDSPLPGRWAAVVAPSFAEAHREHGVGGWLLPVFEAPGWRWRAIAREPDVARRYLPPLEAVDEEARAHLARFIRERARGRALVAPPPTTSAHVAPAPGSLFLPPPRVPFWRRVLARVALVFAAVFRRRRRG